jgi:protein-tyrosine-phosphatase
VRSDSDRLRCRAARHAALADPTRLAIVDDLAVSDRSPSELADRRGIPRNLVAHHLDVLEEVGLIVRFASSGDRRRRYVRLVDAVDLDPVDGENPDAVSASRFAGPVAFVCTHNSARSQLAAALWTRRTGRRATSAGTHPADRVHPGAVDAALRAGLDLTGSRPRLVDDVELAGPVVTVCDRAHEELGPRPGWWHWSLPDPVGSPSPTAFDDVVAQLDRRMRSLLAADPLHIATEDVPS